MTGCREEEEAIGEETRGGGVEQRDIDLERGLGSIGVGGMIEGDRVVVGCNCGREEEERDVD